MNVELTPDQRAFVQKAIDGGRFTREEEAVKEALALWERRERRRLEIIAMIDEADSSLARGDGRVFTKETNSGTDRRTQGTPSSADCCSRYTGGRHSLMAYPPRELGGTRPPRRRLESRRSGGCVRLFVSRGLRPFGFERDARRLTND
jgi:Arc/MetJ-type ribon-helix-helix transcriptional regulator